MDFYGREFEPPPGAKRTVGDVYALSFEHEDALKRGEAGLQKAAAFLREVVPRQSRGVM